MRFGNIWGFRAFALCLGLAVGLVAVEVLLRVLGVPHFHKAHTAPNQFRIFKNDSTGDFFYVNEPSSTITFEYESNPRGYFKPGNRVDHLTNSWGFRGPEFSAAKQPGTIRLLFLGDSFTFGEGVHFDDTFAQGTARLLPQRLGRENLRVESFNMGVGGYNTTEALFLLKSVGRTVRPDAVILCYVLNDAEPSLFQTDPVLGPVRRPREAQVPEGLDEPLPPKTLLYRLRTAQVVWRFARARQRSERTEAYYRSLYGANAWGWEASSRALDEAAALCRREKIPLIVMLFPMLYKLDGSYPYRAVHAMVAREAETDGAAVLDLLPAFEGKRADDLWVFPTDQHPNEKAHRMASEALVAKLASLPEFLEKVKQPAQPPSPP